jgi:hypothetical protein
MGEERSLLAASRRRKAEERSSELRSLRRRLAAGEFVTADDLALAELRAQESQRNAELADVEAASAHQRAAWAHKAAADIYELAGRPDLAALHRRAAEADESAVKRVETRATEPDD